MNEFLCKFPFVVCLDFAINLITLEIETVMRKSS